jgi:hypothetical protein
MRGAARILAAAAAAVLATSQTAAQGSESAAAQLLWECQAMASVLMSGVTEAKAVMDDLAPMGSEGRARDRLALHDRLQQSLVRSEMAASALVRLRCPNRGILSQLEPDLRRAWSALAANRRSVLRAIPP